ncbi:MAG: hypothetical protein ACTSXD_12435 [Candidatus Heimdallarchaeaceae archaeon]
MKFYTVSLLLILFLTLSAQDSTNTILQDIENEIKILHQKNLYLQSQIDQQNELNSNLKLDFSKKKLIITKNNEDYQKIKSSILSMKANTETQFSEINTKHQNLINKMIANLETLNDSLRNINTNISEVNTNTQNKIEDINLRINKNTLYWLITIFIIAMIVLLLSVFLKNKISKSNKNLFYQIDKTKKYLDNESIKLDSKLIVILENQIKVTKDEKNEVTEINHSLPIQVGLEIFRMRKRIKYMPEDTKGINALTNALERLEDEFKSNGYDMVDLLNKPFNDGLTVEAKFFPSDELKAGEKIITKVIKPQINYKGILVFQSKIEVTEGI